MLFGDKEIKVDIPRQLLLKGAKEGSWLKVSFELDSEGEKGQREKIRTMLEKLKKKGKEQSQEIARLKLKANKLKDCMCDKKTGSIRKKLRIDTPIEVILMKKT